MPATTSQPSASTSAPLSSATTNNDDVTIMAILAQMSQQQSPGKAKPVPRSHSPMASRPLPSSSNAYAAPGGYASSLIYKSSDASSSSLPPLPHHPPQQQQQHHLSHGPKSRDRPSVSVASHMAVSPGGGTDGSDEEGDGDEEDYAEETRRGQDETGEDDEDDEEVNGGGTRAGKGRKARAPANTTKRRAKSAEKPELTGKGKAMEDDSSRTRKDNHKEVERRRRETINDGINDLKKIVPGCEKNKGSILQRAVQYIQQLKDGEATNIEKWTLQSVLLKQGMDKLEDENAELRGLAEENEALREENEELRRLLEVANRALAGGSAKRAWEGQAEDPKRARVEM